MKKLLTLILTALMALTAVFGLTACSEEAKTKIGVGDGTLIIGYTIYPPMNYTDDGEFVGFDTELAKAVCGMLNVKCEFKEIVWKNKVMALNTKEIDVVWNGMTITAELQDAMSITSPYLQNKQVIICKTEDAAKFSASADKKGLDASGLEVLVETNSAGDSTVTALGITPTKVSAQKDTLLEVKTGSNKVAVIDKLMADVLVGAGSANPELTYVDVDFPMEYFGIGCRKQDTATMFAIENAIARLKADGTFDTLINKYFG
ncbi:MAG: transporter substrate-binding domain-containing protein [Clostridia bacterium]|nr:transporter substrate-binding domain-containing protein [Clostridia bacterium]